MSVKDEIQEGMAKAFFASAYAEAYDEAVAAGIDPGFSPSGCDWMDLIPDEIDHNAVAASLHLMADMQLINGMSMDGIYSIAEAVHDAADKKGDRDMSPEMFGHYCAMQAMGHGVGLCDAFGQEVREAIKVPYREFSPFDLEKDYFGVSE